MTFVEQFVKYWAHKCADRIEVERAGETEVRITLGMRSVVVSMDELIMKEEALRAIGKAVDDLFGMGAPKPEEYSE